MKLNVLETSKKLNMSPHTIRYYTNVGLVPSLEYDEHGNRVFDGDDLNWLLCARFYGKAVCLLHR
ncbi:MAG: MerR family transcriptional regulator [Enterocloster sp.]